MGYDEEQKSEATLDSLNTPSAPAKRKKHSFAGSDADWKFLMTVEEYDNTELRKTLNFDTNRAVISENAKTVVEDAIQINTNSVLFPYIKIIHYTLHLLYEELKLNTLRSKDLPHLAQFLSRLSVFLDLKQYSVYYWKDFSELCKISTKTVHPIDLRNVTHWSVMSEEPISIMQHIYDLLKNAPTAPFPFIPNVNPRSKDIVQLCGALTKGPNCEISIDTLIKSIHPTSAKCEPFFTPQTKTLVIEESAQQCAVLLMTEMNITMRVLDTLPVGISLLLYDALWACRENPPADWPAEAYNLLWRSDLVAQSQIDKVMFDLRHAN